MFTYFGVFCLIREVKPFFDLFAHEGLQVPYNENFFRTELALLLTHIWLQKFATRKNSNTSLSINYE